jgi:hypothetical protein
MLWLRLRKGDRRQETGDIFAEIGLTICDLEFGICDFEFGICDLGFGIFLIWQFLANLAVYSSKTKKNKAENDHWSSVKRLDLKKLDIFIYIIKIAR